jgi:tetratricopeptide (TPR) repeat protein
MTNTERLSCSRTSSSLVDYVHGELSLRERRGIERHLSRCPVCAAAVADMNEAASSLPQLRSHEPTPESLDRAFAAFRGPVGSPFPRRVEAKTDREGPSRADEQGEVAALVADVRSRPSAERPDLVRNSAQFHTLVFCERSVSECFELVYSEPAEALSWGEVAVAAADALDERVYEGALVEDMRGRARVYLANARRVMSDFTGSRQIFREAHLHFARGSGDPLGRGHLFFFEATLRWAERQLEPAHRLLDRAMAYYEQAGDKHLVGVAMFQRHAVLERAGDAEGAVTAIRDALPLLDPVRDPRVWQIAHHALVWCLNESGRHDDALALLEQVRAGYSGTSDRMLLLRLTWTEGRIELSRGRLLEAEQAFTTVRSAFIDERIPIEVALASLDLAVVYLRQGRTAEIKRLAVEMLTIFRSLHIHREAIAALMLLQQAVEMETLTLGLITELAAYLERSRNNLELRFKPSLPSHRAAASRPLATKRAEGSVLIGEVRSHLPAERPTLVRDSARFHNPDFCDRAVRQCFDLVFSEPHEAVAWGEVAVAAADALGARDHGEAKVEDLRGRARLYLANALRVASDFTASEELFRSAHVHLAAGTGDPVEYGHLFLLESMLRYAQRRFDDAHQLLDQARDRFESVADTHSVGRVILMRGAVFTLAGESERAIDAHRQALELLDRKRDPRQYQIAQHSMMYCLNEAGRHDEAFKMLEDVREGYRGTRDRMLLLRLTWTEGRIELARGRLVEAEAAFSAVRNAFIQEDIPIEVALASLDLALVYYHQRRTTEMKELAVQMLTVFRSLRFQREAIAALMLFQRAAQMETVTVGLITELAKYLERSRHNPDLRFEPQVSRSPHKH